MVVCGGQVALVLVACGKRFTETTGHALLFFFWFFACGPTSHGSARRQHDVSTTATADTPCSACAKWRPLGTAHNSTQEEGGGD